MMAGIVDVLHNKLVVNQASLSSIPILGWCRLHSLSFHYHHSFPSYDSPQNPSQQGRPQQAGQQIALQSFGSPASSTMDISSFSLDSPEAAKQMAALNAASQARIAQNARIPPSFHPPSGGTSSGSYLGGINSHSYAAGNHDLLNGSANGHANFQIPNNQPLPQTPNSATSASFVDSSMSHPNALRNPQGPNQQRKLSFLTGLANAMAKRGTPLPPALTGVAVPNYDPNNSPFAFVEPSTEVGSFRLAGKDVDLLKLWATVFANHGGHAVRYIISLTGFYFSTFTPGQPKSTVEFLSPNV